jgi:putative transposase
MSRKYKFTDNEKLYFVTFTVIKWIDLFTRQAYKDEFLESVRYCQREKDLEVYAWCIMTNHVHLIIGSRGKPLPDIVRDLKSYTSRRLRLSISDNLDESRRDWLIPLLKESSRKPIGVGSFQLWQRHNHPIELSDNFLMDENLEYIHQNPVKAGFVEDPAHWLYSSARDYEGGQGLLDIFLIE